MADTNNQNSFLDYAGLALFWNNVKQIIKDNELVTSTAITDLDTRLDQLDKNAVDLTSEQTITAKKIFSAGIDLNGTTISKVGSPVNTDDAANKQYVDTKIDDIPIEKGSGENSTIQSSGTGAENKAISENSVALGSLNTAGTKAYKWNAINFDTKTITLVDTPSGIVTGDRLSIINKNHYDDCCQVVSVSGKNIVVDSLPFTVIESDSGEDAQTIFVVSKPNVGNVDIGQCAFAEGGNTMATQMFSHAEGYGTKAIGQYSHAEGRETEAVYAAHAEGRGT